MIRGAKDKRGKQIINIMSMPMLVATDVIIVPVVRGV
uniref:Uncharacterized protein n=1 Tax=Anopheles quadriannulatus TaxID=34691 RepID=A0A182XQK4_ANOQN